MTTPGKDAVSHRADWIPFALTGLLLGAFRICSFDAPWHIEAGRHMWETRGILHENVFAWTYPEHPWTPTYWLFELLLAGVHTLGGFPGLVVLQMLLLAGLAVRCGRTLLRSLPLPAAIAAFVVLADLSMFRWFLRPHLFTFIGVATLAGIWSRTRAAPRPVALLATAAGFMLWANLHSGVIYGLAWLALAATGDLVDDIRLRGGSTAHPRTWLPRGAFLLSAALGAAINPTLAGFARYVLDHVTKLDAWIQLEEFAPILQWAHAKQVGMLAVIASLILLLLTHGRAWTARRALFFAAGLAFLSQGVRFLPDALLFWLPVFADAVAAAYPRLQTVVAPRRAFAVAVLIVFVYAVHVHLRVFRQPDSYFQTGFGLHEPSFPVAAAGCITPHPGLRIYNSFSCGGYLLHRFDRRVPVFFDGRIHAYPAEFVTALEASRADVARFRRFLDRWRPNAALIRKAEAAPAEYEVLTSPPWVVHYEDNGFLYVERTDD